MKSKVIFSVVLITLGSLIPTGTFAACTGCDRSLPDTSPLTIPRKSIDTGPIRSDSIIIKHYKTVDVGTPIYNVEYSPSGDRLASYFGRYQLYDADSYNIVKTFPDHSGNNPFLFSADGTRLYNSVGHHRWGYIWTAMWAWIENWKVNTGRKISKVGGQGKINGLVFGLALSPNGDYLAVGDSAGDVTLWKTQSWELVDRLEYKNSDDDRYVSTIGSLQFTPNGKYLLACCYESPNGSVIEWNPHLEGDTAPWYQSVTDLVSGKTADREQIHRYLDINGLSDLSPDGNAILTAGNYRRSEEEWDRIFWSGPVEYDFKTGDTIAVYPSPANYHKTWGEWTHTHSHYSNKQRLILSAGRGRRYFGKNKKRGDLLIWNRETKNRLPILHGHAGLIRDIAYHPTRNRFATASQDGTIKIWSVTFPENAWH